MTDREDVRVLGLRPVVGSICPRVADQHVSFCSTEHEVRIVEWCDIRYVVQSAVGGLIVVSVQQVMTLTAEDAVVHCSAHQPVVASVTKDAVLTVFDLVAGTVCGIKVQQEAFDAR